MGQQYRIGTDCPRKVGGQNHFQHGTAIQNRNRLPKKSRWPKSFSTCHEADGRSKMRRKRSDQRADREAEATTITTTGAEARAPETPAIIATPAQRPWRGNDERQWRLKRGVAPSLVRNQDRNRVLVQRRDHALRAAKHDPAHALRSALALAAAGEDRNQSALALVLKRSCSKGGKKRSRSRSKKRSRSRSKKRSQSRRGAKSCGRSKSKRRAAKRSKRSKSKGKC